MAINFNTLGTPYPLTINGEVVRELRLTQDSKQIDKANKIVQEAKITDTTGELSPMLDKVLEACTEAVKLLVLDEEHQQYIINTFSSKTILFSYLVGDLFGTITEETMEITDLAKKQGDKNKIALARTKNMIKDKEAKAKASNKKNK